MRNISLNARTGNLVQVSKVCFRRSRLSSVAKNEVAKFATMNQTWWDASKNPLIHMNTTRVDFILNQVSPTEGKSISKYHVLKGKRALDIGCGGGLLSESLCRLGAAVVGVDPSEDLINGAKAHALLDGRTQSIDYRGGISAEDVAETEAKSFDIVCLLEVIEHATDTNSLMQAATALVKPGGLLFVSTMNKTYKSYLLTILGAEYLMGYLPIGTHDWNRYLTPDEVRELVSRYGMIEENRSGMVLARPPFFGQWDWRLVSDDFDVNWIAAYRKDT